MNMAIVVAAIGVVAVLGDYGNGIIRYLHNSYGGRIV